MLAAGSVVAGCFWPLGTEKPCAIALERRQWHANFAATTLGFQVVTVASLIRVFSRAVVCLPLFVAGPTGAAEPGNGRAAPVELQSVRTIERSTPLSTAGRPPALLAPSSSAYAESVGLLAAGLAAVGIAAEQVADIAAADPAARTVICLGTMVDNPLIERLYWNRYTWVDALKPGNGRYLLHTVYDPYPFNGGHNVIIIGCLDAAGAVLGVKRFLALLEGGSLPYVVESGPQAPSLDPAAGRALQAKPEPTFLEFLQNANGYLQTGAEAHARQAIAALDVMARLYAPDGQRGAGTTLTYERLPFDEEMASWEILCAWDAFEECPLLTDVQRLAFSNVMLRFTRELVRYCSEYRAIDARYTISWNHTTFPLLGLHFGARYFDRYYHLADLPEMLTKARMGFTGQARSWKPQEDADLYMTLTTEHAYIYCMAENRMDAAVIANLKRSADYVVGWCDNLGRSSGFGDATIITTTRFLGDRLLPLAQRWTGDGGYGWLMNHYSGHRWKNPFSRGEPPVRPDRLTGVNVFKMDPAVYEFTQTRPSYNEPFQRADVSPAEAFDKISFRENWEPDGQYLIIDGLARGKHLHYDGNSILEFVEGGERWLLSHDYLTRNTTEHSMLSILRDGRCDQLVPSLAGLAASGDLPGIGYTRTFLKNYNGCDWQRQILWRKGGWFLVADSVTPRVAGDYTFDLTWKTIDRDGNQRVDARGNFVAARGVGRERTLNCSLVDEPGVSGKSLQLDGNNARVAFGVDLPAGDYSLTIVGKGRPSGGDTERSEAVRISVDLGSEESFGLSPNGARPAGGEKTVTPAQKVTLRGEGPHLLLVTPVGHRTPLRIDRFVFEDAKGAAHVYEAEHLPPAPPSRPDQGRQFFIKPADAVASWVSNHERSGIPVPISILHQRKGGELRTGEVTRMASLIYASRPGMRRDLQPSRVAENVIAIHGGDPGLVLLGDATLSGLVARVEAGWVTPQRLAFVGLRQFHLSDLELESPVPDDLELDLATGEATVQAPPAGVRLMFINAGRSEIFDLEGGRHAVKFGKSGTPLVANRVVEALIKSPPKADVIPPPPPGEPSQPAWLTFAPDGQIATVKIADLDDGEGERIFVCRDKSLHCLSPEGRLLWQFDTAGTVRDVAFGELRPNPGKEILVGSADTHVYLLSSTGQLIERHQMRGVQYARSSGDNPYGVFGVGIWDLKGDGKNEMVVTLSSYDVQVLSSDWRLRWNQHHALHGSTQLSFEDLDGDRRPDTLLVGDKYGNCIGLSPAGMLVYRGTTSIGDVAYVVTSLDGGKTRHIVSGSSAGDMMATVASSGAKPLWRFDNFGYAVNRLRVADVTGGGASNVIVASGTGYLYVLNADGRVAWQNRAGHCINDVIVIETTKGPMVAYCDESGPVCAADARGKVVHEFLPPSPARRMIAVASPERELIVMVLADGRLVAYDLRGLGAPAAAGTGRLKAR